MQALSKLMQYHENDGPNRRGWKMQEQSDFEIDV